MRPEVVAQLPLSDEDGVQELLDLRVMSLRVGQDLANEVNKALHLERVPLFPLLHHQGDADYLHGGHNVE
jgi:hypothetical protein